MFSLSLSHTSCTVSLGQVPVPSAEMRALQLTTWQPRMRGRHTQLLCCCQGNWHKHELFVLTTVVGSWLLFLCTTQHSMSQNTKHGSVECHCTAAVSH